MKQSLRQSIYLVGHLNNQPLSPEKGDTKHACQQEGCSQTGIPCEVPGVVGYPFDGPLQYVYYCVDHCFENGYCSGCGQYWAGDSRFDYSLRHLCPNCDNQPL